MLGTTSPFVIAIDGPAAAGKGTLARRLADHLGYAYLETGLLYRAVAWKLLSAGASADDAAAATAAAASLTADDLQESALRSDDVANPASKVAAIPAVRAQLLRFQRDFAAAPPGGRAGAVLDGRDIGTVVCPDAPLKLFITASLAARAERRLRELRERGHAAIHTDVLKDMQERDTRDRQRAVAPLEPARDAVVIDTTGLSPDQVFEAALKAFDAAQRSR
jgi:cytidylate kinase